MGRPTLSSDDRPSTRAVSSRIRVVEEDSASSVTNVDDRPRRPCDASRVEPSNFRVNGTTTNRGQKPRVVSFAPGRRFAANGCPAFGWSIKGAL